MRSTTYQCDQCADVLVQGLSLEARHFTLESTRMDLDPALVPYLEAQHFCDLDCLLTYARRKAGDLQGV